MKVIEINKNAIKIINDFKNLNLGNKKVITPYFINDNQHKDLRAMVGKGTAEEIVMEAKIWEKIKGIDFNNMSENEIKLFLIEKHIGIDCSGFVIHVLNGWYRYEMKKNIWGLLKPLRKGVLNLIRYKLRPVENLGAEVITNEENTIKIKLSEINVGDLIRSKSKKQNSHHIMLVTKLTYDGSDNLSIIEYTHSTPYYGLKNGIKSGVINIMDINKSLVDQKWLEEDEFGVNHTLEGFKVNLADNGLRRLKLNPTS